MTAQAQPTDLELEQRIAARTEELLRTNALLGEEIARHEATERALRQSTERLSATLLAAHERSERAARFSDALYELAGLDKAAFDDALAVILQTAARALQVERVSYWSLSGSPLTSERAMVHVRASGTSTAALPGGQIDEVRHPRYFAALATHRPIVANRAQQHPATSEFADTHLKPLDVTSTLDVGVWRRGVMAGVLRYAHVGAPREWQSDEVEFGAWIGSAISLALEAAERHAVAHALEASEEKYRLVVDNASEAIVVAQDGVIRFANPVAVAMSGYSRDEYHAMPFINLIHPDDRERVITNYRKRMAGEAGEKNYVFRIVNKTGDVIWLQINAVPITWEGRPATLNFLADITERERLQQDLRRTLAEREAILQSSLVGIVFTRDRIIHWINRTLEVDMLGYAEGELVGKSTEAFYVSRTEFDDYGRDAYRTIAEGTTWQCEMQLKRSDGNVFWAQETGQAMDPADVSQGAIWVMTDISRRRQAEEELRRALAQERELSELKSRFVSMTSHEFRTPLATILSATELIEKYGKRLPQDEQDELIGLIKSAVVRMTTMLDDVLLIGKADAGRVDFHPAQIDVGALATAVVEEVGRSTGHRSPIDTTIAGDCRDRMLDEKLVRHILGNLLSNAVKYSAAGSPVRLRVECTDDATRFEVEDRGIGIPREDQARVFSTFHRGANVSNVSGTGLGLAIVRKCVAVHRGTVSFVSEPGRGTTFTVALPQPDAGASPARTDA